MMTDERKFFDNVRSELFAGRLAQTQVDGINAIRAAFETYAPMSDPRFLAYGLATAYHETARDMTPIAEIGRGVGRPYGAPAGPYGQVYYGRGYVQLTWLANYQKADALIAGGNLVRHPEDALIPAIAGQILVKGMMQGWFTGHKLGDFFAGARSDWVDARAIINGRDRAALVAAYALHFYDAILGGGT